MTIGTVRAALAALLLGTATASAAPMVLSGDMPVQTGLQRTVVAEGLENPWGMAFLPEGGILVTERPGRVRLVARDGTLQAAPVPGTPAIEAFGQGGLMDIALHPGFAENGLVYFTLTLGTREENRTAVARARFDGAAFTGWETLWQNAQAKRGGAHFGSRLLFLPDGTLLVSIGDGGNPPAELDGRFIREFAQEKGAAFGKVLRMTEDGQAAPGNPFAAEGGTAAYVWTLGHRNIQGLARDPATGAVFATEHGALGGDELNRLEAGANYGWPVVSHAREYVGGAAIGEGTAKAGMADPLLVWANAAAPSGLAVYTADALPDWKGDILSGSLRTQDFRRIDRDASGAITGVSSVNIQARVRDVRVGPDGLIYVLTDERAGRLLRFGPAPVQ